MSTSQSIISTTVQSIISILRTDLSTISPIITNIDNSDMSESCKILFDDVIPCIRDRTKYYDDNSDTYEKTIEILETDIKSIVTCLEKMPSNTAFNCIVENFYLNCCKCIDQDFWENDPCQYYNTCYDFFYHMGSSSQYCDAYSDQIAALNS